MDAEPYVGEIRMFAGNYAPQGWALCNGQTLQIGENQLLYALIGTIYGGTSTSFNLPDLRGRVALHQGSGYNLGTAGGQEYTTLTQSQMPAHTHPLNAQSTVGTSSNPANNVFADTGAGDNEYTNIASNTNLAVQSLSTVGGNSPFSNVQPSMAISFIIALTGIYPTPN